MTRRTNIGRAIAATRKKNLDKIAELKKRQRSGGAEPVAPKPRKRQESRLLADIRVAVGARHDFMLARINTGVFKRGDAHIRSAPNGYPDIMGTQLRRVLERIEKETDFSRFEKNVWRYYGQSIAIETKSKNGTLSEDQENFRDMFTSVGGIYILARSVEDVLDVLGPVEPWAIPGRGE